MSGSPLVFEKFADGGLPRLNGGGVTLGGAAARHRAPQINHPSASPLAAPPMASRPTTEGRLGRRLAAAEDELPPLRRRVAELDDALTSARAALAQSAAAQGAQLQSLEAALEAANAREKNSLL